MIIPTLCLLLIFSLILIFRFGLTFRNMIYQPLDFLINYLNNLIKETV